MIGRITQGLHTNDCPNAIDILCPVDPITSFRGERRRCEV
jgi:hypothetical protein